MQAVMHVKYHHDAESPFYELSARAPELQQWKPTLDLRTTYISLQGSRTSRLMQKLKCRKIHQMLRQLAALPCKIHLAFMAEMKTPIVSGEIVICHEASEERIKRRVEKIKEYAKAFAAKYPHTELEVRLNTHNHPTRILR